MPTDDTKFIEFVLGTLDKASHAAVERKIETSVETREKLAEITEALNLLAEAEQPAPASADLRARLMKSLQHESRFQGFVQRLVQFYDLPENKISEILKHVDNALAEPWGSHAFPGTHLLHFDGGSRVAAADCGLVYVEPGRVFPAHRHLGDEWTFILQGRVEEIGGGTYEPGEIVHKSTGTVHAIRALGNEPLVLAVLLHGGVEFVEGEV